MPKVGKRNFPYSPAGKKAAQAASKQMGKPVVNKAGKKK